jgi:hypothetical protein
MGNFYFHLRYGDELVTDTEGANLPDIAAARQEALESAREILADAIRSGRQNIPEAVVVADESGLIIDSLRLAAVLPRLLRVMIAREP